MAVCATYFTFGDLHFNPLPAAAAMQHYANVVGFLIANVIEVEDEWIRFPAVDARVFT